MAEAEAAEVERDKLLEQLEEEVSSLKQQLLALAGSLSLGQQLQDGWHEKHAAACKRLPPLNAHDCACPPNEWEPNEHGLATVTVDSISAYAMQNPTRAVMLMMFKLDPSRTDVVTQAEAYQNTVLWVSKAFAARLGAPSQDVGRQWTEQSVHASVALRNNSLGLIKTQLMGDYSMIMLRTMMYQDNAPADPQIMWFMPCIVRHEGAVHRHAFVGYTAGEEAKVHLYESVMHDHLGLKFTPVIVNMVDLSGYIIHQNAASMAAFGIQGLVHRSEGDGLGFNLLDELFLEEPALRAEMTEVTTSNQAFSRIMHIKSPVLRKWLDLGTRDAWHQVQVSRARDAMSMQYVYAVAQVDVTAAVQAENQVVRLQAENHDLQWTTAWLEDQKAQAEQVNQRLKESLAHALAARDGPLRSITIDTDSPADKAIKLLNKILEGQDVSSREAVAVRDVILAAGRDLLQPVNFPQQVGAQMGVALDEEVGQSLIDLLVTKRDIGGGPASSDGEGRPSGDGDLNSLSLGSLEQAAEAAAAQAAGSGARASRSTSVPGSCDGDAALPTASGRLPLGSKAAAGPLAMSVQPYYPLHASGEGYWQRMAGGLLQVGSYSGDAHGHNHRHHHHQRHHSSSSCGVQPTEGPAQAPVADSRRAASGGVVGVVGHDGACRHMQVQVLPDTSTRAQPGLQAQPPPGPLSPSEANGNTSSSGSSSQGSPTTIAPGGAATLPAPSPQKPHAPATSHFTLPSPDAQHRPPSAFLNRAEAATAAAGTSSGSSSGATAPSSGTQLLQPGTTPALQGQPAPAGDGGAQAQQQQQQPLQLAQQASGGPVSASSSPPAPQRQALQSQRRSLGILGEVAQGLRLGPATGSTNTNTSPPTTHTTLLSSQRAQHVSSSAHERSVASALHYVVRSPPDHLAPVLAAADEWGWDAWALHEASGGRPLSCLAFYLLQRHHADALRACSVDAGKLCRFLVRIEDDYLDNAYHNRVHAADVLQWMHMLMTHGGVLKPLGVGDVGTLAVYLSAAVHDVNHKGVNNDFLVRSADPLALLYNDVSPMENHHLALTFQLLAQDRYNFLAAAPAKVKQTFRKQVITMVLATDMKQHFTQTSLFKSRLGVTDEEGPGTAHTTNPGAASAASANSLPGTPDGVTPQHSAASLGPHAVAAAAGGHSFSGGTILSTLNFDEETKGVVLSVALKCADLGNLAAPPPVNARWVEQLQEEYFTQGNREQAASLAVSALMDRTKAGVSKSQSGFFSIVGLPLFRMFAKAFPGTRPMLDAAVTNYTWWHNLEEEARRQAQTAATANGSGSGAA